MSGLQGPPQFLVQDSRFCDHVKDSRINIIKTANRLFISATFGDAILLGKFLDKETFDMKQGLPLHQCNPEVPIKKALASRVSSSSTHSTPSSRSAAALVRGSAWSRRQRVRLQLQMAGTLDYWRHLDSNQVIRYRS